MEFINDKLEFLHSHGLGIDTIKNTYRYTSKYTNMTDENIVYTVYLLNTSLNILKRFVKRKELELELDECLELVSLVSWLDSDYSSIEIKQQGNFKIVSKDGSINVNINTITNKSLSAISRNIDKIVSVIRMEELSSKILELDLGDHFRIEVLKIDKAIKYDSPQYKLGKTLHYMAVCKFTVNEIVKKGKFTEISGSLRYTLENMYAIVNDLEEQLGFKAELTKYNKEWEMIVDFIENTESNSEDNRVNKVSTAADALYTVLAVDEKLNKLEKYWVENKKEN